MESKQQKVLRLVFLSMMIGLGVVISPILRVEGMCPMAHLINITCSVMLGPWYSLLCATLIGIIRMMPIKVAHKREYQGPSITEQVMLIRWAMGHMPSTRRMGEITTPRPIIMDKNTRRRTFCCLLSIKKLHSFMGPAGRSFRRGVDSIFRTHSPAPERRQKPVVTVGTVVPSQPGTRAPSLQNEYRSRALPLDRI